MIKCSSFRGRDLGIWLTSHVLFSNLISSCFLSLLSTYLHSILISQFLRNTLWMIRFKFISVLPSSSDRWSWILLLFFFFTFVKCFVILIHYNYSVNFNLYYTHAHNLKNYNSSGVFLLHYEIQHLFFHFSYFGAICCFVFHLLHWNIPIRDSRINETTNHGFD